jgi:hypothetical protein
MILFEVMMPRGGFNRYTPKVKCTCINCGIVFEIHKSSFDRGEGKLCSKKCEGEYKTGKPIPKEVCIKRSLALKGRKFTEEHRANISKAMKGKPSPIKGMPRSEQQKEKQRQKMLGRKHTPEHNTKIRTNTPRGSDSPHWLGGVSFGKYCPKFNDEFKERVRAFFDYKCLECGTPQNGEKLAVHHILYNKRACCDESMPMFAPLCRSCHAHTNFNRETWELKYAKIIQNNYSGKSFFTKEEYAAYKNSN